MRHFDTWILRDPYSIFHYYSTGRRWQESIRDLIHTRQICSPPPLSSSSSTDLCQKALSTQQNSSKFLQLPPEIRLLIYEYVFGNELIHLVQIRDKIRHVRCQHGHTTSLSSTRSCCPNTQARWRQPSGNESNKLYPHTHPSLPDTLSTSSLSLLRTCRAIYLEASDIPYSSLRFDVDDLHTFIAFTSSISPVHLRQIKHLSIQYTPIWSPLSGDEHKSSIYSHTHNDHLWTLFWSRVGLCNLQTLHLSLDLGQLSAGAGAKLRLDIREAWVRPLMGVRVKEFELGITASADEDTRGLLEDGIVRDAGVLREGLKGVMCSRVDRMLDVDMSCEVEGRPWTRRMPLAITAA